MTAASQPTPPAPSLWRWLAISGLPLLLLLLAQWWLDVRVIRIERSSLTYAAFFTFLAVYPFCYFLAISLAAGKPARTALLNGMVALCALLVAGVALFALVFAIGLVSLGLLVFPAIPAAGAAYGLAIDRVQRLLLGDSPGWRASWRRLHWVSGLVASPVPLALVFFDRAIGFPGPQTALLFTLAAAPHLLWTWILLRRKRGMEFTGAPQGRRGALLRLGAVALAVPVLGYFGETKVRQFERRPPLVAAGHVVDALIADRRYAIPGEWIARHSWWRYKRRFWSVALGLTFAADGSLVVAPVEPLMQVSLDGHGYNEGQAKQFDPSFTQMPCRTRAFGELSGCWVPRSGQVDEDPIWTAPPESDFTARLPILTAINVASGIILLDEMNHAVGFLERASPRTMDGHRRYRLIMLEGAVRWTVPLTEQQLPSLDRIVDGVSRLQRELAAPHAGGPTSKSE